MAKILKIRIILNAKLLASLFPAAHPYWHEVNYFIEGMLSWGLVLGPAVCTESFAIPVVLYIQWYQ